MLADPVRASVPHPQATSAAPISLDTDGFGHTGPSAEEGGILVGFLFGSHSGLFWMSKDYDL